MEKTLCFNHVLTRDGILHDRQLELDSDGRIQAIAPAATQHRDGWLAIAGIPNAHSHIFQRALAGFGEARAAADGEDSFWSWREAMYRLAGSVTPDDLRVIARQGFIEMLRGGFTSVAEFHYLHHLPDGSRSTAMAEAVIEAARDVGIRLRLLPVAYFHGGFGKPPTEGQQRFVHRDIDEFLRLIEQLKEHAPGLAPHSLRAVAAEELAGLVSGVEGVVGEDFPIHIHISEQVKEVAECEDRYGRRPVALLADSVRLGQRWNLVHATHVDSSELRSIVDSDTGVVLCPITEAYLGDGLFPATDFAVAGGQLAVGSDSNCRIDAFEELRWLEYGQRLREHRRARLADATGLQPVHAGAVAAGARALGLPVAGIAAGQFADLLVFEEDAPCLLGHTAESAIDALIINGSPADPAAVYVGGERLIEHGRHEMAGEAAAEFGSVVHRLLG